MGSVQVFARSHDVGHLSFPYLNHEAVRLTKGTECTPYLVVCSQDCREGAARA